MEKSCGMSMTKKRESTKIGGKEQQTRACIRTLFVDLYELDVLYAHQSAVRNFKSLPMVSVAPSQFFYADAMQKLIGKG
jgi:hypothetical protein